MLFLDNPVGAGFSFTDDDQGYPDNEDDVSKFWCCRDKKIMITWNIFHVIIIDKNDKYDKNQEFTEFLFSHS